MGIYNSVLKCSVNNDLDRDSLVVVIGEGDILYGPLIKGEHGLSFSVLNQAAIKLNEDIAKELTQEDLAYFPGMVLVFKNNEVGRTALKNIIGYLQVKLDDMETENICQSTDMEQV